MGVHVKTNTKDGSNDKNSQGSMATAIHGYNATAKAFIPIKATNDGKLESTAIVSGDVTVNVDDINVELKVDSGHDLYVAQNVVCDGTWEITFTSISGLSLKEIQRIENKTTGEVYSIAGSVVTATSILLSSTSNAGKTEPLISDVIEITYRGNSRILPDNHQVTVSNMISDVETGLSKDASVLSLKQHSGTDNYLMCLEQELTTEWVTTSNIASQDVLGYNKIGIFVDATPNDSENGKLRVLAKSGSTSFYEIDGLTEKTIFTTGSDVKKYYEFDIGTVTEIVVQVKTETVGATAGVVTIGLNRAYRF